jgi:hypothetical protein
MTRKQTPEEVAAHIVYHVGAQLLDSDEAKAMARAIREAIRAERKRRPPSAQTRKEIGDLHAAISRLRRGRGDLAG